ncbi:hypothetical protein EOD23_31180, partial [Mesorhizobium sp. USDA-HM6]
MCLFCATRPDHKSYRSRRFVGDPVWRPRGEADLFIQTPGGNVDATEKLIGILRQRLKSWRVIVPSWAKSAGTVIALSANDIVLGINSELGPIDPQWFANGLNIPCDILGSDPTQPYHIQQ